MNDDEINGAKQGGYKKTSCDMICSSRSFIQQQTNGKKSRSAMNWPMNWPRRQAYSAIIQFTQLSFLR